MPTPDETMIRGTHIAVVLGCGEPSLNYYILTGRFPRPDRRGAGQAKLWRLSTIRAWNPAVAENVESLLTHPAVGAGKHATEPPKNAA